MSQENQVLRCYSCKVFQVHLVKKARKWECKMCSSKQSLKKSYGRGSGKDCRLHVMKLNELQFSGSLTQTDDYTLINKTKNESELVQNKTVNEFSGTCPQFGRKWLPYLDEGNEFPGKSLENSEKEIAHETVKSKLNGRDIVKKSDGINEHLESKSFENFHKGNNEPHWYESVNEIEEKQARESPVLSGEGHSLKNNSKWLNYINEGIFEEKVRIKENLNECVVPLEQECRLSNDRLPNKPEDLLLTNNTDILKRQFNKNSSYSSKYSNNCFTQGAETTLIKNDDKNEMIKGKLNIFNTLCDIDNLDDILDF